MKRILFETDGNNISAAVARVTLAIVLFPHGAQKLLGWFGGYGFSGTMNFFTETVHLPYFIGLSVILIEFFGPLFLLVGFGTRVWAALISILMVGIIVTSHAQNGFFMNWFGNQPGEGFEFDLLVIGLASVAVFSGSGMLSVDNAIGKNLVRLAKSEPASRKESAIVNQQFGA